MEITNETIMPDGRPFHAWEAEMSFYKQDAKRVEELQASLAYRMKALHIGAIEMTREHQTGDIIIRLNRTDLVMNYDPMLAFENAEVSQEKI